jgi:hypothetical protein
MEHCMKFPDSIPPLIVECADARSLYLGLSKAVGRLRRPAYQPAEWMNWPETIYVGEPEPPQHPETMLREAQILIRAVHQWLDAHDYHDWPPIRNPFDLNGHFDKLLGYLSIIGDATLSLAERERKLAALRADSGTETPLAAHRPSAKGKGIDEKMLAAIRDDERALYLSINQWADKLRCSKSTVAGTKTWKQLCRPKRELERLSRGQRLRRKKQPDSDRA